MCFILLRMPSSFLFCAFDDKTFYLTRDILKEPKLFPVTIFHKNPGKFVNKICLIFSTEKEQETIL